MADKLVQALESFDTPSGSGLGMVRAGDLFAASDPIVKGRENLFGEVQVRSSSRGPQIIASPAGTETADAPPARRRRLGVPPPVTATVKEDTPDA